MAVSRVQETIELPSEEEDDEAKRALASHAPSSEQDALYNGGKETKQMSYKDWITSGSVRFENVLLRYRPELPPALKNLSFRIRGGKKVGIVGRSGCGKSTVLSALFRMVGSSHTKRELLTVQQMEVESGCIFIDGVDIRSMPRAMLRNAMTIIPQARTGTQKCVGSADDIAGPAHA